MSPESPAGPLLLSSLARGAAGPLADAEGQEHAHCLLEHLGVAAHLIADDVERGIGAEGAGHLLAQLVLVAHQRVDRKIEIGRDEVLDRIAVEADELAQEGDRQQVLALVLLLEDDLGEHRARDVLARLGVDHDEILVLLQHVGEVLERHIGRGAGVVETPVRVFLDCCRRLLFRHARPLPEMTAVAALITQPLAHDRVFFAVRQYFVQRLKKCVAMQR